MKRFMVGLGLFVLAGCANPLDPVSNGVEGGGLGAAGGCGVGALVGGVASGPLFPVGAAAGCVTGAIVGAATGTTTAVVMTPEPPVVSTPPY